MPCDDSSSRPASTEPSTPTSDAARVSPATMIAFDSSTTKRRGIAVSVTRTIPLLYSPPTASTASTATSTWPR